jgi:hypothetical protein
MELLNKTEREIEEECSPAILARIGIVQEIEGKVEDELAKVKERTHAGNRNLHH